MSSSQQEPARESCKNGPAAGDVEISIESVEPNNPGSCISGESTDNPVRIGTLGRIMKFIHVYCCSSCCVFHDEDWHRKELQVELFFGGTWGIVDTGLDLWMMFRYLMHYDRKFWFWIGSLSILTGNILCWYCYSVADDVQTERRGTDDVAAQNSKTATSTMSPISENYEVELQNRSDTITSMPTRSKNDDVEAQNRAAVLETTMSENAHSTAKTFMHEEATVLGSLSHLLGLGPTYLMIVYFSEPSEIPKRRKNTYCIFMTARMIAGVVQPTCMTTLQLYAMLELNEYDRVSLTSVLWSFLGIAYILTKFLNQAKKFDFVGRMTIYMTLLCDICTRIMPLVLLATAPGFGWPWLTVFAVIVWLEETFFLYYLSNKVSLNHRDGGLQLSAVWCMFYALPLILCPLTRPKHMGKAGKHWLNTYLWDALARATLCAGVCFLMMRNQASGVFRYAYIVTGDKPESSLPKIFFIGICFIAILWPVLLASLFHFYKKVIFELKEEWDKKFKSAASRREALDLKDHPSGIRSVTTGLKTALTETITSAKTLLNDGFTYLAKVETPTASSDDGIEIEDPNEPIEVVSSPQKCTLKIVD